MNEHSFSPMNEEGMMASEMTRISMYDFCMSHKHHYIMAETKSGEQVEGIIYKVDRDNVYLLIPAGDMGRTETGTDEAGHDSRYGGFGFPGYGFGYQGYGFGYPGYGYGYGFRRRIPYRFRRFRRYRYPFFRIHRFFFPVFY